MSLPQRGVALDGVALERASLWTVVGCGAFFGRWGTKEARALRSRLVMWVVFFLIGLASGAVMKPPVDWSATTSIAKLQTPITVSAVGWRIYRRCPCLPVLKWAMSP